MNKHLTLLAGSFFVASSLLAGPINITIYDGRGSTVEDNETEPGTVLSDAWDLEAFGYNSASTRLDLIGTYNFKYGESASVGGRTVTYTSGAIFVNAGSSIPAANGWTYAYVLNFGNNTYNLYDNFSIVTPTQIGTSSPWTINKSTATLLATGNFTYVTGLVNPDSFGLTTISAINASKHRMVELNLSDLPTSVLDEFVTHFTMGCGNDELEGHYKAPSVPDSGTTLVLLGLAFLGLVMARNKLCLN